MLSVLMSSSRGPAAIGGSQICVGSQSRGGYVHTHTARTYPENLRFFSGTKNLQMRLMLLVQESHFENHCCKETITMHVNKGTWIGNT